MTKPIIIEPGSMPEYLEGYAALAQVTGYSYNTLKCYASRGLIPPYVLEQRGKGRPPRFHVELAKAWAAMPKKRKP